MRSLTLGGTAILMASVLAGCASGDSPTAPTHSSALDGVEHNVAVHDKFVEELQLTYENPCNGELVPFFRRVGQSGDRGGYS